MSNDPELTMAVGNPFAALDPDARKTIEQLSKKIALPGAQYTVRALSASPKADTPAETRWNVRRFAPGEAPLPGPVAWDDEEDEAPAGAPRATA